MRGLGIGELVVRPRNVSKTGFQRARENDTPYVA
jgi:hypothetical protein